MPSQAQLYIGQRVHDFEEIEALYKKLGVDTTDVDPEDPYTLYDCEKSVKLNYQGEEVTLLLGFHYDNEGSFPVPRDEDYSSALVGISLTSRYAPTLLDRGHEHGRPDPFELDLGALASLLEQVRTFWPEAEVLMMDIWY